MFKKIVRLYAHCFIPRILPFYFFLIFFLHCNQNIYTGTFEISPTNYGSNGMSYSTSGGTLINDTTAFYTDTTQVQWTISGFNLRYGDTWLKLNIVVTPGTGSTFDMYLYSDPQTIIYSALSQNASIVDLDLTASTFSSLKNGVPFYLKLVLNPAVLPVNSVKITDIAVSYTYTENSLVCYPAPYQISNGSMTLLFDVPVQSKVTLEIYDDQGRLVKTLFTDKIFSGPGTRFQNTGSWDGTDSTGRKVNTGVYEAIVKVNPVDKSLTKDQYTSTFKFLVVQ